MKTLQYILFAGIAALLCTSHARTQTDTIIDNKVYSIIERYANGKPRIIGQFGINCVDSTEQKHGDFITFDPQGR